MPVTSPNTAFIDALRYGATLIQARFTVYQKGYAIAGPFEQSLSTGSITVDRNSAQRRSGQITLEFVSTVPPPLILPVSPSSLLAPFGTEIFLEVGIASSNNTKGIVSVPIAQWVPLGLFAIKSSYADDTTIDLVATLDLADRSYEISQRTFKQPYNFPAASGNYADELQTLLNQVWNQTSGVAPLQYNIVPTDATIPPASYNQGSDPWQAATDISTIVGYELFFDVNGIVTARPIPNPSSQPVVWNFTDDQTVITSSAGSGGSEVLLGSPYSTPVEIQIELTRDGIYNDIEIEGTGTANSPAYTGPGGTAAGYPILASAIDTNPASPTYVNGGLGDIPNFVSSSLITDAGAQSMANNELALSKSSSWLITMQIPPNPIFDIDDVVAITRPRLGLSNTKIIIDTITHSIRYADLTSITGRVIPS